MGFVLSVLYFVTNYLTPATVFGPLAPYRIELILAVLVFFVSLPTLARSFIMKTPQSLALVGLTFAAFMSVLIGVRWAGGAVQALLGFIPNAFGYFLVCLHCNSKRKLQILVLMLVFVCLFVIARGWSDLKYGVAGSGDIQPGSVSIGDSNLWNNEHPYLLAGGIDAGETVYRLRGRGLINDPNDFGQLVVSVIPLVFIFWRARRMPQNIAFVLLPVCALLYGVFLTHSRGALLALTTLAIVAARRRIGTLPALLVVGTLFVGAMAMHFTGGRAISAESGADRTALWSESMQLLKSHPLFGVGAGSLSDYLGHTAHNSLMVCAAELGMFGLYLWCLFLFPTVRDALAVSSQANLSDGVPMVTEDELYAQPLRKVEEIDSAEVSRLGRLVVLSLTGFLVAGWFLSRAFVMTLFLLGGMAEVVYEMALQRGMIAPRWKLMRVLAYSGGLAVALLAVMYIMLRIVNLMH